MASTSSCSRSMPFLSRALSLHLLPYRSPSFFPLSRLYCTSATSSSESESEPAQDPDPDTESNSDKMQQQRQNRRLNFERPLEDGIDQGVFKAFLLGKVGQQPLQKKLRSGRVVTLFSLGTGGIRNNRRPLDDEDPKEYANRCSVQWHRVSVYPERLGVLAKKHVKPGSILYLEGNLETKIFTDPISGIVKRIREIAIRRDGRLIFLGKGDDDKADSDARGVGYFW